MNPPDKLDDAPERRKSGSSYRAKSDAKHEHKAARID
jgi:hypothetical protein